jgi:polyhydroxyalkanoate synthesis regulator phasin
LAEQKAKEAEAARIKAEADRKTAEEKALNDGKITAEDTKKVLDNINSDGKVTQEEVKNIVEAIKQSDAPLTVEQKDLIATVVIAAAVSSGENVTAAQIQDAGIEYKDLPASTPVEVRTSESGEALVITAEVAANVELVTDPGALLEAAFTDPGAALAAIGSIGADMTEGEREEATEMVVATVVAAGAAINAAAVAVGGATGGGTGGGGSSGGGGASGANSPGSRGGRKW